jgi:hypothetical protein
MKPPRIKEEDNIIEFLLDLWEDETEEDNQEDIADPYDENN